MDTALCRRTKQAASVRFCARIEEEDGEYRCVRYRLLLLPPSASMVERLLQRLPQVHIRMTALSDIMMPVYLLGHGLQMPCSEVITAGAVTSTP